MENIIQAITEAEEKASAIKQGALLRVEQIVAQAEKKAAETEKTAREVCKAYKATQTAQALKNAEEE